MTTGTTDGKHAARTLFEKVWDAHVVRPETAETPAILYIDLHLMHEVTSPQAFSLLRERGLKVRRPERTLATTDHSTPTLPRLPDGRWPFFDAQNEAQVAQIERNAKDFGIELHGLGTQCLVQRKPRSLAIRVDGRFPPGVTAKDLILAIIAKIGVGGGTGHVIEFVGPAVSALTMEGRMTLCNMAIEGGARAGMVAPDDATFEWLAGKPRA